MTNSTTAESMTAIGSSTVTSDRSANSTAIANLISHSNLTQALLSLKLFQDFDVEGLTLEQRLQLELEIVAEARETLARVQEMLDSTWRDFLVYYEGYNDEEEEEGEEEEEEEGREGFLGDVAALGWFDQLSEGALDDL
ncbi:hypothetical protein H1R20_g8383, partial [Candolleomyces eurysporus]